MNAAVWNSIRAVVFSVFVLFCCGGACAQGGLPSGWSDGDVGSVGVSGSATYSTDVFTVKGSGTGMSSTADGLHFVYQPLSGDGTIVARVVSSSAGQAGVMIRGTLDASATNAFTVFQSSYTYFYSRGTTGGNVSQSDYVYHASPFWVKLVRSGNTFSSYTSPDGVNWTQLGTTQTITMAQSVYMGLVVSSQGNSSLATATFDNVSISSATSGSPIIANLSATTGPIGSQVVISGSGFGVSQGASTVLLNGSAVSVNAWSDASITVTIPTGATSGPMVVSVAPGMDDSNPPVFTVTSQPLPIAWLDQDIGTVGVSGSATYSGGVFTVRGSGNGMSSTADGLHFAYQPLSGDGTIVARVVSSSPGQAGVMIRETLDASATNAFTVFQSSYTYFYSRGTTGGNVSQSDYVYHASPFWVKLVRSGNTFSSYTSPDGVNWTQLGTTQTITMAQSVYMGLAISSQGNSSLATATFDNVSISSLASPAPAITGISPSAGVAGSQIAISGSGFGSSQGASTVSLNGSPLTVNSWSATSVTATIPAGSTSGAVVILLSPNMNTSNPFPLLVGVQPLPSWLDVDLGTAGLTGNATYGSGTFTIKGSGSGINGTADAGNFLFQSLAGDGTIVARIVSVQGSNAQAGIMVRETLNTAATDAFAYYNNYMYFSYRTSTGDSTGSLGNAGFPGFPYWLKLVRAGNVFSAYVSVNGIYWTQLESNQTIAMGQNVYVGLAVSSQSNSSLATATFDNVSIDSASSPAPVISNMSATTGPVGSELLISGSGFGASQGSSSVFLNGAAVTVNFWSSNSLTVTIPTGATSGPMVVSVAPSMIDSNPVAFEVTSQPVPSGWLDQDIGAVGGSASFSNNVFTVNGAGGSIWSTADAFHYVYQPLSGDGSITARVATLHGGFPEAGVMIRETLGSGATEAFVYFQPNQAQFYYRSTTNGSTAGQSATFFSPAYPYWAKLTRSGNVFTGYTSLDGVYWTQVGTSQTITMAQNVYMGLAVAPQAVTGTFDNVSVSTSAAPAPAITALSTSTGMIGSQITITGSGFGTSQNGSAVTLNNITLPITSWSATSITTTIPAGASSGLIVVSVSPGMNDSNPVYFEVTPLPIPTSWLDQDVGSVGVGGSTYTNGVYTVSGAGAGMSGTADGFHFLYQALSGDGTIVARVMSLQGTYPEAGVMIRETLDPGSTNAFVYYQPNQAQLYYRSTTGATMDSQAAFYSVAAYPYWVKLTRSGNIFSAYISPDGVSWTAVGPSQTISMAQNVYIGLAVAPTSLTASFDNVSVNSSAAPAPVITTLSATTGPIGTQIVITGSHFGNSRGTSGVFLSDAPMAVNSWSDASITATISAGAISGYLVVAVAPGMNSSNAMVFTTTSQPLPSGWLDTDIGSVGQAGSATYSAGVFTVKAGGQGINGTADGFHFVFQPLSGDGAIVARVSNIQVAGLNTQIGVMIRETLNAGATDTFVMYYPNTADLYVRPSTDAASTEPGYTFYSTAPYPYWVKLARIGNALSAYISGDGVNWLQVGTTQTVAMAQTVDIGLAAANGITNSTVTAAFDNVSVVNATMPNISGVSPSFGAIGTPVAITGSHFGSTQGTGTVNFNGGIAIVSSWTDTQIVAIVPSNAATGAVSVVANSIQSNTNYSFTFYNPVITSISPAAAQVGANVTVNGSGFGTGQQTGFQLLFNGVPTQNIDYSNWTDNKIISFVPQGATTGPVTVSLNGIVSNTVQFSVEPLSVTGVSPSYGPVGSLVTITGTGFGPSQANSSVDFSGIPASVQSWSDTQIVAVVPPGANSGSVNVTVGAIRWYGPQYTFTEIIPVMDSQNHRTTYSFGLLGGMWVPLGIQGSGCSTCTLRGNISYTYDFSGHVHSRTDENGNTTTNTYDANGNLLTVTVPISPGNSATTTYTYNSYGEVLTATDPMGFVTTNTYDANGNLLSVTAPAPGNGGTVSVTQFAYDSKGELTQITDPLNHVTTITYFPTGLVQTITDAQNHITTYGYDSKGNRTSVTDAANNTTTFAYDAGSRLQTITYPDSSHTTTTFTYDARGRRTSVTDQNGRTTTYAYDDADRLISVTDAANNVTSYGYDSENNLTSIQDANHNTTNFAYDAFGRATQTTFPSSKIETYGYDNVGNLISKIDRNNQLIAYTYDQLNRLTQKTYPDASSLNYTYDSDSRLTQVSDPTGTYQFTFDNMGRLTGATTQYAFLSGRNFTTSYTYDAASNRNGFTDPENGTTAYVYDTLNRLQTLTPPSAMTTASFGFGYDVLSRRTSLTRPNNVNTTYSYDNLSRLLSVTHAAGGTTLDGASYTTDNAGNRLTRTPLPGSATSTFGYDNIYELLSVNQGGSPTESYTYDPVGNRLSNLAGSGWSSNSSNELTSRPGETYTYDNDGNTLTKVDSTGTTTYNWDYENRLTTVTLPGGSGNISFKYDPFGRRIYKSSPSVTFVFAYDEDNLVEETNSSGAVVARYSRTQRVDEPLVMLRSSTTSYYNADALGSITSLSSAAGALAQTYTFDSFGKQTASSGSLTNTFQYAARESDGETGLYYYRARYYDEASGRFLGEDPLGFVAGINFYDYVGNSPIGFTDPMGLTQYPNNFVGPLPPEGYYTRDMTLTSCGLVPPHPTSANIDENMAEAQKHWNPFWFRNQVKDKAPWDYKRKNPQWEDFGNFNYGATGIAFGFSATRLQREAGRAQDPNAKGQGDPGWLLNPWGGTFPYGDDLPGQFQVMDGIEYAKCKQRKKCGL